MGLISGLTHYLSLIYWITVVLGHYGNLGVLASLGPYLLLCLYLALFPAFFAALCKKFILYPLGLFWISSLWISLEYVRSNFLTGFPWCLLGYTQYKQLYLIQIADMLGVYGISFLIVLINGYIFHLIKIQARRNFRFIASETFISLALLISVLFYGYHKIEKQEEEQGEKRQVRAVIVQGNIDQSLKWEPAYQKKTMEIYSKLTRSTLSYKPDVILWPETAVPFFFQNNREFSPRIISLAKEAGAVVIFGSPAYRRISGSTAYFNRAYLVAPDDSPIQYYDKVHLVPFGEYIPLKNVLSFINRLVPAAGDFQAGDDIHTLNHKGLNFGLLICFESIFPELARQQSMGGADLLVNLTNDAWFGKTSAPHHHLSMAVMRAVENRRPLLRAANTGFSAVIQPQGKIVALSNLFKEETLKYSVHPIKNQLTFYTRYGDFFVVSLALLTLIKIVLIRFPRKNNR